MTPSRHKTTAHVPVSDRLRNANGKTVAAVILVSVMLMLWGRVLLQGRSGPASAAASQATVTETFAIAGEKPATVIPVELMVDAGRHDVLRSDIFSTAQWDALNAEPEAEQPAVVEDTREQRHQQELEAIAATLKLEAIICDADGKPQQIYVNDAVLTVGSVLTVREGPVHYELVLSAIRESEATFDWSGASITLKMTETVEQ